MARDQVAITVTDDAYTELTNADPGTITFQVTSGNAVIRFTTDDTQPAATLPGLAYGRPDRSGELKKAVTDLTHLAGAKRVWARGNATILVDHDDA